MHRNKFSLFITLILIAVFTTVGVVATSADPAYTTEIAGHNLSMGDNLRIVYYVDTNAPANVERGILFWLTPQEPDAYTYGNETYKVSSNSGTTIISEKEYLRYVFSEISAKKMTDNIYAVSYVKDGEEISYSTLDKYSVLQYCYNKKDSTSTGGGAGTLGDLVATVLNYGAAAQEYFGYNTDRLANDTYYQINVVNGTLPDGTAKELCQEGDALTLTAGPAPANRFFTHWENSAGTNIGETEVLEVFAPAAEEIFTAVYRSYSEGLAFTSNGDGTCYVSGIGTCEDTEIYIPPTALEGQTVTSIGISAFSNNTTITYVRIPDSVTSIGNYSFFWCTSLTGNLVIPDSVTSIGNQAFYNCTGLTSATIGNGVTDTGYQAFYNCSSLTSITIADSVTSIGESSFGNCSSLTSITIPDNVTSIGWGAFSNCSNLTSITIPNSVTNMGGSAFHSCTRLTSVTIPGGVTSILSETFYNCRGLTSITIPENVTNIGNRAFSGCSMLADLIIPDSVTSIGSEAFYACSGLTSITISDSVTSIGNGAFNGCSGLTSISLPNDINRIENSLFYSCHGLTSIIIPDEVTNIGYSAFGWCYNLTSITIPASVTNIEDFAFYNCSGLTSITFEGTKDQWNAITKESKWNNGAGDYTIHCTDGDIAKS